MKKFKIIPIFVPHKGCPHQCSFCNQRHITGQHEEITAEKAHAIIKMYLTTIDSEKNRVEIAFFGGSFTAIDMQSQNELLNVALEYKNLGRVHGIRLSTRPDYINDNILQNLKSKGVTEIELGVQSMCDNVLKLNNRGHSPQDVVNASKLVKDYGFTLGLQMMVGLIGDTKETSIFTAREIAKSNPDFVRIYPTLVFKNTDLYDEYKNGTFVPLTLDEAVDICAEIAKIFDKQNIKVIRLGLLMSDEEAINNFVAGPHHPRFRELVEKQMGL